ncbi:neutral and basic amino acid transport protein rBAT-like isoform X2 [Chelonus insularis]|uniref:neutral and basic amino acid transport protein rBAT-like isoform X2 n=1 Tax=Chelonus insularis TaxID=460826 RepID=UPI00158DF6A4|nr:neutral and basic amino acid transport protein rBAT-like isoform X2 [Chelonus insularis]
MERGSMNLANAPEVNSTTNGSVATYKSLPEDNSNWDTKNENQAQKMGKTDEVEIDDGAKEKMLNDPTSADPIARTAEIILISENGDAKITVKSANDVLCGMGKEELMKYANDPFWVRLRWVMFIGFWILWFAMLFGAIAIIVFAPKCSAPIPKKWWEKSPIIQIDSSDLEGKDIKGVEALFDTIKGKHVQTIALSSILKGTSGHVEDFKVIKREIGDMQFMKDVIAAAKQRDQRIVLEVDPNHSSINHPWFNRSVNREEPYTNYYVWADGKNAADGTRQPPNNWLSVYGGSAWAWHQVRGQYYLHQLNKTQPDFNFENPSVINEFVEIFQFWLSQGISGFRLGSTQYLTEDPHRLDEKRSSFPAEPEEYQYLNHVYTQNRQENVKILKLWREKIANITKDDELFTLQDDVGADTLAILNENQRLIDLPQKSQFLSTADAEIPAEILIHEVTEWISRTNVSWPGWDVNGKERSLRQRMPINVADSITLMTLLLPGTPIFKLNDTLSAPTAFAALAAKRNEETFLYGDFKAHVINGTVFAYTRLKGGHPGYLVAYQSSRENASIDVSSLSAMPSEVSILTHSPNYVQDGQSIPTKLSSDNIPMAPKSTVVLTFVPES